MTTESFGNKPFGLHEVVLIDLVHGGSVALPAAQTFSFGETVVSEMLEGNDAINAVATIAKCVEWELENGGISLAAYALMTGRTPVSSGTTPNQQYALSGKGAVAFPYFKVVGRALGDGIDDVHCTLFKCKLTDNIEGEFAYGKFWVTKCKGVAIDNGTEEFQFVENETAAACATS